ncbi:TonB-dependent receptor [Ichthyenterobacterium sp. W332]|uniref:TonB-dependent receptor n=1 Tax=Microcosmobacter mediterraneus TaxID=3075607 RepID=A0ABU2YPG3_9FLAO|nr:TonB-dependent receptor [Ichthyenterobacterium sp. W332]MDT0558943.1 TonB-dependent receptor [Ichthyenterobacterium sp. W332]
MNLKTRMSFLFSMLCCLTIFAQDSYLIKGKVISEEDSMPIPGVNIVVVTTSRGTSTDFDGNYEIEVKKGEVLQFSYLGYVSQTIVIDSQTALNVTLKVDTNSLDEVVVVGYGTRKKKHLTGAVSSVVNKDLDQLPVARVDDALVGQIAGLNVAATEGEAGSDPTIRIRGVGSLNGDSAPLIVIDGLVVDSDFLGNLDMNEVESFDVLKDAASSAIYGSRGANGVIIITTKQGKEGKARFTYNTFTGFKTARESDDYYFTVAETAEAELAANGVLSNRTAYKVLLTEATGIDRDWQDEIFETSTIESHSFSARGGSKNTKYSASFGYLHDEGVLLTDDYKRYNARFKIDSKVSEKFKFGVNLAPSYTRRRRFDGSTHDILRQAPWLPLYHDANSIQFLDTNVYPNVQIGDYAVQRHFDNYDLFGDGSVLQDISNTSNTNPAAKVLERDRNDYKLKLAGRFYGQYKLMDGLTFRASLAGDYQNTFRDRWQGVLSNRNGAAAASYFVSNENRIHILSEGYFTYDKVINGHEFNVTLGASSEKWEYQGDSSLGSGYTSDLIRELSAATVLNEIESYNLEERFRSFFGRVNYVYKDKYLASLSFRRDGSSIFGSDKKYGNFPAGSIGWRMSEEDFLSESDVVSNLKLRVSYGFTGNKDINFGSSIEDNLVELYPSIPLLGTDNYNTQAAFIALNIANPGLQWERLEEFNPGIDFGFFNNKITGSLDYYERTSDKLLLFNPVASTTGFSEALVNLGEVKNSGIEIEFRTRNISTENFSWNTTILASMNDNELTDFGDANGQIQNVDSKRAAEWINLVGNPISSFYGWVVDTDIPLEFINDPYHPVGGQAQDVYVKDLNGDGLIDDDDKTILGSPYPDLVWSLGNEFKYKDFDLSFLFQGSHGAEVRNMGDQYLFNHFNSAQDYNTATTPNQGFIREKIFTNAIIQDASYVALRNITLGYNLPQDISEKIGLSSLRVYASGQNLMYLTASDYTGFNPESINNTSPTTYGYQRAGSPIFSTISFGLNVQF